MESQEPLNELEPHQLEDIFHEDDVPLTNITQGNTRWFKLLGLVLPLLLLILGAVIKIPREVNLTFTLQGGSQELIFQYPQTVYITQQFVQVGDSIQKGQKLVAITSPFIVNLINEIDLADSQLSFYQQNIRQSNTQATTGLTTRLINIQNALKQLEKEIQVTKQGQQNELRLSRQAMQVAQTQWQRNQKLYQQKVLAKQAQEESLQRYTLAVQTHVRLQEQYRLRRVQLASRQAKLRSEVRLFKQKKEALRVNQIIDSVKIIQQKLQAKQQLKRYYGDYLIAQNSLILRSNHTGVATLVSDKEGALPAGEILLRLKIRSKPFVAMAQASSSQRGSLKKGQDVVLKYESFPHYYYGTMQGCIQSVSQSPNMSGNYLVKIQLTNRNKLINKVVKGMKGQANVIVEYKSVLEYILMQLLETAPS